eukprot:5381897-Pyramimonas_sp.AAC.1
MESGSRVAKRHRRTKSKSRLWSVTPGSRFEILGLKASQALETAAFLEILPMNHPWICSLLMSERRPMKCDDDSTIISV